MRLVAATPDRPGSPFRRSGARSAPPGGVMS
ncbi:hypothetical protein Ae263Ps1_3395c [Pseudonocardia sp. Ae263_Ps1]|nr:hypothetical protein Ae263Ps1_3395c [Pseudonocardia sp. Ae263_Ps1]OLL93616.1 hypothetical protein Ae356Ps1_3513 [Pseudonocardia sp. Ae356_Ps1]